MNETPDHRAMDRAFKRGDPRELLRTQVEIAAVVREPGLGAVNAMILDLSITGFRMRCMTGLTGKKIVFLKLPSFEPLESRICWEQGGYFGGEFRQSLHPAVYHHIIAKYPTLRIAG
ncbi:hypothetical protein [Parasphingorhabdus sp.]|uniref:hypothetical protein n=1 Tax=Parasphingorhabdus sp. TaxID=2709688 RepID=UPI003264EE45